MKYSIILSIILFISIIEINCDLAEDAGVIDKAKDIFDNIKKSKFYESVNSLQKWGLPLLKSLASFAKVLASFIETESKELKFMKEQFKIINQKMDQVDQEFENVKRAIDWNVVKIQYSKYEMAINILQDLIMNIPETEGPVRTILIDKFVDTYEQIFDSACDNIYNSFVNNRIYNENLVKAIRKFTDDHQGQVEKFFMGNINLIMKGLQVEQFYNTFKNYSTTGDYWNQKWQERLNELSNIMKATSKQIHDNWFEQIQIDTESFNVKNYQKSNQDYLAAFYKYLEDKYPWRQWAMVVYNDLSSDYKHFVSESGGLIRFRLRGKNIVFGSIEGGPYRLEFYYQKIQKALNDVPTKILSWGGGPAGSLLRSLVRGLSGTNYSVAAVIEWGGGVWYKAPYNLYRKWQGTYNRFIDVSATFNMIVMM